MGAGNGAQGEDQGNESSAGCDRIRQEGDRYTPAGEPLAHDARAHDRGEQERGADRFRSNFTSQTDRRHHGEPSLRRLGIVVSLPQLADLSEAPLQSEAVERLERQVDEDLYSILEFRVDAKKEAAFLFVAALESDRIGNAPMGGYRLARPDRAHFAVRLVADCESEIEW